MSSAQATFFLPDGTVLGYGIYYGTADMLLPVFAGTPDAAGEARARGDESWCTCGTPPEPVVILSEYGGEWWWHGEWCPRCRAITGPHAPDVCQVCHESPYYGERHECVRAETHAGRPVFPVAPVSS